MLKGINQSNSILLGTNKGLIDLCRVIFKFFLIQLFILFINKKKVGLYEK